MKKIIVLLLGMLIFLPSIANAGEVDAVISRIPKQYEGSFSWNFSPGMGQKVKIQLTDLQVDENGNIVAEALAMYTTQRGVTSFPEQKWTINPKTNALVIEEGGELLKGKFLPDYQRIIVKISSREAGMSGSMRLSASRFDDDLEEVHNSRLNPEWRVWKKKLKPYLNSFGEIIDLMKGVYDADDQAKEELMKKCRNLIQKFDSVTPMEGTEDLHEKMTAFLSLFEKTFQAGIDSQELFGATVSVMDELARVFEEHQAPKGTIQMMELVKKMVVMKK